MTWSMEMPGVNVRGAFFHPDAGEEGAVGAGVIAAAVHAGHGVQMVQLRRAPGFVSAFAASGCNVRLN